MITATGAVGEGVLLVEDSPVDARLVAELLRRAWVGGDLLLTHVERIADVYEVLDNRVHNCVILDLSLPDADRLDGLARIQAHDPELAVVVITGRDDTDLALQALQAGAQDYLLKNQLDGSLLARAVRYAVERKRGQLLLAHQALHDPLTGLPNRTLILDRLGVALARTARQPSAVGLLFLDVDRFKLINDSLGHEAGDQLLVAMSARLTSTLRGGDTAGRLGGDEFLVLCEGIDGVEHARALAERIRGILAEPIRLAGREIFAATSVGVALSWGLEEPQALLRNADMALYAAKELGRNRVEVFDETLRDRTLIRLDMEHDLQRALNRDEFGLAYQSIVDLATGGPLGVEALLRWHHPSRGLLFPGEFIAVAEDADLISRLGGWVLQQACHDHADLQAALGVGDAVVSVNVAPRQLLGADLLPMVDSLLLQTGLQPGSLWLEVTESAFMNLEPAARLLGMLRERGIRICVDDFGTGYSALAKLLDLPVDVLKLDRAFVTGLDHDPRKQAVLSAVIDLAHSLDMLAVAEGVETADEAACLTALGCDAAQGHHWMVATALDRLATPRPPWIPPRLSPVTIGRVARSRRGRKPGH
ncbi:MAG TPA: EAL domain-containing protein [Acidimicrobiales bacterium]|nr:EAL domain-containing protein [Acidimicrobiales bacterium]